MRDLTLNSTSSWLAQFPDSIFKLQQKGRVVCTVPSPISHFWQFFIYQPHCTLIKWVFFFSEHCFQVLWHWPKHWSQCPMLRIIFVCQHCLGFCFLYPYFQPFTCGSLHSAQWLLLSPALPVLPLINRIDLQSHSWKTFLKRCYRRVSGD